MSLTDEELTAMRATSTAALPDTCTIKRLDWPDATLNASDGTYTPGDPTTVYTGACRLRPASMTGDADSQGDSPVTVTRYRLTVPYDTGPVKIGDIAEVTVSDDPQIGDRSFRVVDRPAGSWQIDQRLVVEEVVDRV